MLTGELGTARNNNIDKAKRIEFGRSIRELLMQEQYVDMNRDAAAHLDMFFGIKLISDEAM